MNNKKLLSQGLYLEYITLAWNIIGCLILLVLLHTTSISLFGFGVDSTIEILASTVVIWQLKAINKDREKLAEKMIGISFILLSIYILVEVYFSLNQHIYSEVSLLGGVWLFITAVVMFALAYGKSVIGKKLNNPVLKAEAKVTVIDGLLAVSVLVGLLLNAVFGLWWADAVASLVIVWYGMREALHVLR
jgi:divalent metal cation (Fe/Co/Zn/Cd) transporter